MGLFRRNKETLNEQLLRQAGLDPAQVLGDPGSRPPSESAPDPPDLRLLPSGDVSLGWLGDRSGTNEWDAIVTVRAAGLAGDLVEFTTLPNGDIIVEKEKGDGDLSPLADAIEEKIDRPYKASAARHDGGVWAVGAKRIEVARVELAEGSTIELSENDGVQEVRVDGEPSDASVPELQRLGRQVGDDYCVEAERIDGDFWEVRVSAL